ncbi:MAG: hypothetical protein ACON38_05760 [Akkermansiaceae bacterium]
MKLPYLLTLLTLFVVGCRSDESAAAPVKPRSVLTAEEQAKVDEKLTGQKIGALLKGKISWLREGTYQRGGLDRVPDLYLFYFTASW